MRLVLLASVLGAAGPPANEPVIVPVDAAGRDAIGIVWHDQATVAPVVQQRLADAIVRDGGEFTPLVVDAVARAQAGAAQQIPRARMLAITGWERSLEEATSAYRAGEIDRARGILTGILEAVVADPVVPGAVRIAWKVHVLRGQIAWTEGDLPGLEAALAAAVALDPEASLSTRRVPPPVAEAHARQRAALESQDWPMLRVEVGAGTHGFEIDGIVGPRPVPPGEHIVVVRRPGAAPVGRVMSTEESWVVPPAAVVIGEGLPADREAAERLCEHGALRWLLLARQRGSRLGLQRYRCGAGFGPAWYEAREGWAPGLALVRASPPEGWTAAPVLHRAEPWPALPPAVPRMPLAFGSSPPRARGRSWLPWLVISGAIAGSVTLGVIIAGDVGGDLAIDGNSFLRR